MRELSVLILPSSPGLLLPPEGPFRLLICSLSRHTIRLMNGCLWETREGSECSQPWGAGP